MSIRIRLFLGFSVLGLLIPLGILLSLGQFKQSLQKSIGNDFALLAQQTLDKIDRELSWRLEQVSFHAQHLSQLYRSRPDSDAVSPDRLTDYCHDIVQSTAQSSGVIPSIYRGIQILDDQRHVVAQAGSCQSTGALDLPPHWLSDVNQPAILLDDSDPNQRLTLLARLEPISHQPLGFIRIDINPQGIFDILEEIPLETSYESTQVHLLSRANTMIYSTVPQALKDILKRRPMGLVRLKAWKLYPKEPSRRLPSQLVAQAISRGFHAYNGLGWRLVIAHDTQEVLQPVRTMSNTLLLPATGITLLAWIFALGLGSSISHPLRQLEQTARDIREGDLNRHINLQRHDEIGSLAQSLESMTQRLRQTIASLQNEINERRMVDQHLAEVNRDLAVTINQLESAHKEVSDFAYAAAHDLKTPIRGMITLIQWIVKDHSEQVAPELLDQMDLLHIRAQRCASLVDGILDYCRAGHHRGRIQQLNCDVMIRWLLDDIHPSDSINIHLQEEMPIIKADTESFINVLRPLLLNALQYCDSQTGEVHIRFQDHHDHWTFSVQDNGPGIAPEHHKRIFGIFQTLSQRDETEHAGIGLTIAQKIIRAWGGELWLESELGQGSTFYFTWPKYPCHLPPQLMQRAEIE